MYVSRWNQSNWSWRWELWSKQNYWPNIHWRCVGTCCVIEDRFLNFSWAACVTETVWANLIWTCKLCVCCSLCPLLRLTSTNTIATTTVWTTEDRRNHFWTFSWRKCLLQTQPRTLGWRTVQVANQDAFFRAGHSSPASCAITHTNLFHCESALLPPHCVFVIVVVVLMMLHRHVLLLSMLFAFCISNWEKLFFFLFCCCCCRLCACGRPTHALFFLERIIFRPATMKKKKKRCSNLICSNFCLFSAAHALDSGVNLFPNLGFSSFFGRTHRVRNITQNCHPTGWWASRLTDCLERLFLIMDLVFRQFVKTSTHNDWVRRRRRWFGRWCWLCVVLNNSTNSPSIRLIHFLWTQPKPMDLRRPFIGSCVCARGYRVCRKNSRNFISYRILFGFMVFCRSFCSHAFFFLSCLFMCDYQD